MQPPNLWYAVLPGDPRGSIWVWGIWSDGSPHWIRLDTQDGADLRRVTSAQSLTGGHPVTYTKGPANFTDIPPALVVGLPLSEQAGRRPPEVVDYQPPKAGDAFSQGIRDFGAWLRSL